MNLIWELSASSEHCPSCKEAAGQIHPQEVWEAAGITPGSEKLYCGSGCNCQLLPTDQPERGNIASIPIKGAQKLNQPKETRSTFTAEGSVNPSGAFEILAITAGNGNGWEFSEAVLQESLPLWDNAQSFIDHSYTGHSVKDLGGILHDPIWDPVSKGIKLNLKAAGPSANILTELGRQVLAEPEQPAIGFSADVLFTASGNHVDKILKVYSVDLVIDPARGGQFLRALNSKQKGNTLMEPVPTETDEKAKALRVELCKSLLASELKASNLPEPQQAMIRKQFDGADFAPEALAAAIEEHRTLLSSLTAANTVQGPRITAMVDSSDQLQAATYDLFNCQRPEELKAVHAAKLSGIRELYVGMTGDLDFHGSYDQKRAMFANTTATLPGLLKNALNKTMVDHWAELGRAGYTWWEPIVQVQHFTSLQNITGVLMGEVTLLPSVAEGGDYTELTLSDSPETASFTKYGGYVGITIEMMERDELHKLVAIPRKLATSALRRISALVAAVFTANSGVGPAMADTYKVFDATHHSNLGTTALSGAAWDAAGKAIYNQKMVVASGDTAPILGIDPKYILVPRDLRLTAMQILYPSFAHEANYFSENQQRGNNGDVITVPEFSDANDWAAVADPRVAPAIILAERFGVMPEIYIADSEQQGSLFSNDQARIKARMFNAVLVADYRPLYKANVA